VEELAARVHQQEALARLGMSALSGGEDLTSLMDEAVRLVAETLTVEYAKVLELLPEGDALLLRTGVGWDEGYVGRATVGTNLESQAGYALISGGPVVCDDLHKEVRFKGAPLLHDHGVLSGVTAAIWADGRHYGVLSAHTGQLRSFNDAEARFVQDVADVLGAAIERGLEDERARAAFDERAARAEAAERRFEFLAEANALLSASSTDYATTLANAARLAVPVIADWCFVDVVEDGGIRRVTVARPEPGAAERPEEHLYTPDPEAPHGTTKVLRTGRPELVEEADASILESIAGGSDRLESLPGPSPVSYACVPLRVRQRVLGTMGFVSRAGGRYDAEDLALKEGLAHCAALAIENALHHVPEARLVRELLGGAGRTASSSPPLDGEAPDLTRRQLEVLNLLGEGRSAKQIARELYRSEDTVRNHIRAIKHALDARSQLEAVARARKLGLLSD
jgi:GAF domain-containing protein